MGELAARTIFSNDTGPLAGTGLDTLAKNQGAILELEGAQAPQSKTITDGSISPTAAYVIVDTEGSAAADDLDVINPVLSASENLHDGMVVYLKAADSGRVVTVKNSSSANGINTYDGNDYVLSTTHWLKLQLRADGKWHEIEGRAMETALAAAAASTPATTTARGTGRVATAEDTAVGSTITNGPAFLDAATWKVSATPAAGVIPLADADGSINNFSGARYATCATAAATAAKDAALTGFSLVKGSRVFVTFANANTVAGALTLNVNGTGAKPIYNEFGVVSSSNVMNISSGMPTEFIYDGTNWTYLAAGGASDYIGNAFRRLQAGTSTIANINTKIGTGVGSWMSIAAGTAITLPAGGTWFYWVFGNNGGSGLLNAGGNAMGVVAGGSAVPCTTANISGFAIRIA